ncbi:MAG: GNAT family N-acetyltransferase [Clostridia bacterium]|nr:GNAT family N-acetyltransferase [Clostridia bacterium]
MSAFSIQRIHRLSDWMRIRCLYTQAFPPTERKPFGMIVSMWRRKKTDVWCIRTAQNRFAGFASTINGDKLVLIDYLAVVPSMRGQGTGSQALKALCQVYPEQGLFVEIENPYEAAPNQPERRQRRTFYERCGFSPARTMANVFGVQMELLCHRCSVSFPAYHAFYADNYSVWAAERISELPYPETTR